MQPFHKKANTGAPLSFGEGKRVRGILLYSPQTLPSIGGLQYVVHYWAEALSQKGYQVTVISETPVQSGDFSEPQRGDSPPRRVQPCDPTSTPPIPPIFSDDDLPPPGGGGPGRGPLILRNIPFLQQVAAMRKADKIIMFNVSLKGMPAWLLSGKALYISHHTTLWYENGIQPWQQKLKQWVANHVATANCACSAYIAGLYKKCEVIYSPYRSDVFTTGTMPRIPGSILFAGRLVSDKGADLLLEACAILKAKGIGLSLTIVGDGPDRQKLIALAEQHSIYRINSSTEISPGTVTPPMGGMGGAVSQSTLVRLMQTHEVMVVPSRMEPMGMVVAEGLACGCRMVVSNQGGMPEVGGNFCHYFESGNATALGLALEKALTNPLSINADSLQAHLHKFTIDHSVAKLEEWLGV